MNFDDDYSGCPTHVFGDLYADSDAEGVNFTKIFCPCGHIVDIDSQAAIRRRALGKGFECPACRNARISAELDALDHHYNFVESESVF